MFAAIRPRSRKRCPVLINWSTGGAGPMKDRVEHLKTQAAHRGAQHGLDELREVEPGEEELRVQLRVPELVRRHHRVRQGDPRAGAKPEMECFDTGHVYSHTVLEDLGLLEKPYHFSFIMGVLGGIPATARHLAFQASNIPAGSRWKVIGISREQWPLCMAALSLGGDIRVGLEDNFYLPSGEMAKSQRRARRRRASRWCKLVGPRGRDRRRGDARCCGRTAEGTSDVDDARPRRRARAQRRAKAREMGGAAKVAKHHEKGKLTARERMDAAVRRRRRSSRSASTAPRWGPAPQDVPADAVVCGWGKVDGRNVARRRLRLHRQGRLDRLDRRDQGHAHARARAALRGCRWCG